MSPWWFLDVDGVVNALGVPKVKHGHTKQVDVTALDGDTYPIRYFPAIVDRINTLHRAGLVHIVWLTTWNRSAPERLAPAIGLDNFPVLVDPSCPDWSRHQWDHHRTWWKLGLVREMVATEPDRPVIWTDDDLDRRTRTTCARCCAALRSSSPPCPSPGSPSSISTSSRPSPAPTPSKETPTRERHRHH